MAFMVLFVTRSVFELEKRAGLSSVVAVLAAYYIGNNFIHEHFFLAFTFYAFFACTSRTYQIREGINFGTFKRNVVFFKSIALFHLGYNYFIKYFEYDLISLAMILGGYSLSFWDTTSRGALGVDQTYFERRARRVAELCRWVSIQFRHSTSDDYRKHRRFTRVPQK